MEEEDDLDDMEAKKAAMAALSEHIGAGAEEDEGVDASDVDMDSKGIAAVDMDKPEKKKKKSGGGGGGGMGGMMGGMMGGGGGGGMGGMMGGM
jgi:hypothetical protein